MWDKLVNVYDNIVLVMSGHIIADNIIMTQTEAYNGNTVTQLLIDPEEDDINYGGVGAVAMLYFSEDGSDVTVEYYSTLKEKVFKSENQFTMKLDVVEYKEGSDEKPTERIEATEQPTAPITDERQGCGATLSVISVSAVTVMAAYSCFIKRRKRR
jgi:hypothetical protein